MKTFGEKLKAAIDSVSKSVDSFAEDYDFKRSTVYRWIANQSGPTPAELAAIIKATKKPPEYFLDIEIALFQKQEERPPVINSELEWLAYYRGANSRGEKDYDLLCKATGQNIQKMVDILEKAPWVELHADIKQPAPHIRRHP